MLLYVLLYDVTHIGPAFLGNLDYEPEGAAMMGRRQKNKQTKYPISSRKEDKHFFFLSSQGEKPHLKKQS